MLQLFYKGNMGILQPEIWDKKGVKSPACYLPCNPVLAGKSGWCNQKQKVGDLATIGKNQEQIRVSRVSGQVVIMACLGMAD